MLFSGAFLPAYALENSALETLSEDVILPVPVSAWNSGETLSYELWISPDSATASGTILRTGSAELALKNGSLILQTPTQTFSANHTPFAAGTWHHVALVLSGNTFRLLIDNQLAGIYSQENLPEVFKDSWRGIELKRGFPGRRDELRLWGKAFDEQEFFLNGPLSLADKNYKSLIGVWHLDGNFEDGKWTRTVDNIGLLYPEDEKPSIAAANRLFSGIPPKSGTTFSAVGDNSIFRYSFLQGYVRNVHILYDWISREHLISSSDLIYVGAVPQANGWVDFAYPDNDATELASVTQEASYTDATGKAHSGITAFGGNGASMKVGGGLFTTSLIGNSKFTIEVRLCLPNWIAGAKIFENEAVSLRCGNNAGTFEIQVGASAWQAVAANFQADRWFHLAVTRNGGTPAIYFDKSTLTLSSATAGNMPATGSESVIGENLSGKIDYLRIWANEARNVANLDGTIRKAWADRNLCARWEGEILGRDSASWVEHLRILKQKLAGTRGTRITLCIAGGAWKEFITKTASGTGWNGQNARWAFGNMLKNLYEKYGPNSENYVIDGFDLDFEWPENTNQWNAYANTISVVRQCIPSQAFFSNSLHALYYKLPNLTNGNIRTYDALNLINCQNYGPQQNQNLYSNFVNAYNNCVNFGLPKEKLVFSTPVQGTAVQSGDSAPGNYIKTWREIYANAKDAGAQIESSTDSIPYTFSISGTSVSRNISIVGPDSTAKRAQFVYDKGLPGLMYWDMGEDVAYDSGTGNKINQSGPGDFFHPFSLVASMSRVLGTTVFPKREKTLAIQSAGILAGKESSVSTLLLSSNQAWTATVSGNASWVKLGKTAAEGDSEITIEIAAADIYDRQATIIFTAEDGQSQVLEINQPGTGESFTPNSTESWENVPASGGEKSVDFTTNLPLEELELLVESPADTWLSAEFLNGQLLIRFSENTSLDARSGTLLIKKRNGKTLSAITISQIAGTAFCRAEALSLPSEASAENLPVSSNTRWKLLAITSGWLSAVQPEIGKEQNGTGCISLSCESNPTTTQRNASVTLAWFDGMSWREKTISVTQEPATPVFETEILQWQTGREAASKTVAISTNLTGTLSVHISNGGEWLQCNVSTEELTLMVSENTTENSRNARVEVSLGNLSRTISVTQDALRFKLDRQTLAFSAAATKQRLVLEANCDWKISSIPAWLKTDTLSGQNGTTNLEFGISANPMITRRTGTIVFEYCGRQKTVSVSQSAGGTRPELPSGTEKLPEWDGGMLYDSVRTILLQKSGELHAVELPFEIEGSPFVLDPEWLFCDILENTLWLEADANTHSEIRETYIFLQIKGGGIWTIAVKQQDR